MLIGCLIAILSGPILIGCLIAILSGQLPAAMTLAVPAATAVESEQHRTEERAKRAMRAEERAAGERTVTQRAPVATVAPVAAPAVVLHKTVVVISPSISLMVDQVNQFNLRLRENVGDGLPKLFGVARGADIATLLGTGQVFKEEVATAGENIESARTQTRCTSGACKCSQGGCC